MRGALRYFALSLAILAGGCTSDSHTPEFELPGDNAAVERGRLLVHAVAGCGYCHGGVPGSVAGAAEYADHAGVRIAPGLQSKVVQEATPHQLLYLIRGGRSPNGEQLLVPSAHDGYQWMSDDDGISIVAYLKSLPVVAATELPLAVDGGGMLEGIVRWWRDDEVPAVGFVPSLPRASTVAYGKYIVDSVARCGRCHDGAPGWFSNPPPLSGGRVMVTAAGEVTVPGIGKDSAAAGWDEDQWLLYLGSSTVKGEQPEMDSQLAKTYCLSNFWRNQADADVELRAMVSYLKTLR